MTLRELLAGMQVAAVSGPVDQPVAALSLDSRQVQPGDVFFALPGVKADGARFAEAAIAAGAIAVVGPRGSRFAGVTTIEADEPLPIQLDGEQPGTTPVEFELIPGVLNLRVPARD